MSTKRPPPRSDEQIACEAFWNNMLAPGTQVSWGRTATGEYRAEFAKNAWQAWQRAHARGVLAQPSIQPSGRDTFLHKRTSLPAQPKPMTEAAGFDFEWLIDNLTRIFFEHALGSFPADALPAISLVNAALRETVMKLLNNGG